MSLLVESRTPKFPWLLGDCDYTLVPPFLRGVRGDLGLIIKQQTSITFDVKLSPIARAWK
jgi:hypothetical protein